MNNSSHPPHPRKNDKISALVPVKKIAFYIRVDNCLITVWSHVLGFNYTYQPSCEHCEHVVQLTATSLSEEWYHHHKWLLIAGIHACSASMLLVLDFLCSFFLILLSKCHTSNWCSIAGQLRLNMADTCTLQSVASLVTVMSESERRSRTLDSPYVSMLPLLPTCET